MKRVINQNTEPLFIFDMPDDETLAHTISVKGEKGEKGDPTKLSELENDTGFVTASTSSLTNYYTKTETDAAIDADVAALNVPSGFFTATDTVTGSGASVTLTDTADARLASVVIYGDTLQNGSPTPSSPVDVQVATGEQTITISGTSSQTFTLDLGDMELCKLGSYSDSIIYIEGKYYKHKLVDKVDVSALTGWYLSNNTNFKTKPSSIAGYVFPPNNNTVGLILCKEYAPATAGAIYNGTPNYGIGLSNDKGIVIRNKDITTLAAFTTYLSNNQIYAYVVLAEAIDEEITNGTLISQLDALRHGRSYKSSTTFAVSGSLPVLLSVAAYRGNWGGTIEGITGELTDVVASDAQKATKAELADAEKSYIIDEITVDEYYDETQLTHYWISHIPPKDADGNDIKMRLGLAKDAADTSLRANETARSFAKRKNATLCINAGLFDNKSTSAYNTYPLGIVVKDGAQVIDYRTEIWDEGVLSHTYLQKNRILGVKADMSLERFAYDVTAADLAAANVDFTVTGFGAFMQNGKLTNDLSHNSGTETTYAETADATANINKIYFTLENGEYIGHWRLSEFESGVTYYEQATGDFYAWQLLGQNTTTKDFYVFTCNGKGTTSEKGMSFEQAVAIFQALGCDYGFELDAGGSVGTYYNGTRLNNKTDDKPAASMDGRGYTERGMPTYLYWAKTPKTDIDESVADINQVISDINDKIYDLSLSSDINDVVNSSGLKIKNDTGSDGTSISVHHDNTFVYSVILDYLQQGILALWDNRNEKTVLRVYPNTDDAISFMGSKLALLYDKVKDGGSDADLDNLPFTTGMARFNANYDLTNAPYTTSDTFFYYILQFGLVGNGYNQRIQIAIPQIKRSEINDAIRIRAFTDSWGSWRYLNQTQAMSTATRPTKFLRDGMMIFDTTLGKPIWYNGGNWYDATGTQV